MGDLSAHFSRHEFACKCGCGGDTVDSESLVILEAIRQRFDAVVTITSAFRCLEYNRTPAVGSNDQSQHPLGRAQDIVVEGVKPNKVYQYCDEIGVGGLGGYTTFTHIDTRSGRKARWFGS